MRCRRTKENEVEEMATRAMEFLYRGETPSASRTKEKIRETLKKPHFASSSKPVTHFYLFIEAKDGESRPKNALDH